MQTIVAFGGMPRFLLKYGRSSEGNWNNYKFVVQVQQGLIIADIKYILHRLTVSFLVYLNSGHTAYAPNANRMNVNPSGSQPRMRDTIWNGRVQIWFIRKTTPKGTRKERG